MQTVIIITAPAMVTYSKEMILIMMMLTMVKNREI